MAVAAVGFSTTSAQAVLIDKGNTTIDTASGLEWLDLPLTVGQSYNSIIGGFGGYAAQGYVHATRSQLCGLFGSLGDTITNCSTAGNTDDALDPTNSQVLVDLLGATFTIDMFNSAIGIFDSGLTGSNRVGVGCLDAEMRTCIETTPAGLSSRAQTLQDWTSLNGATLFAGNYLVRASSLPEPATIAIFGLGLVGLGAATRRSRSSNAH